MTRLQHIASFASFVIMAACGILISWQLRQQCTHATPPAIFVACAIASFLSIYFGWRFSKLYCLKPKAALVLFPLGVVFCTSAAVALAYILTQPFFREWEYFSSVASQAKYLPSYMLWYSMFSAVIWLPAFLVITFVLKNVARSELRI